LRPSFGQLLAAVCQGHVGAFFALEASRLARNNRDWHHLIDLCALTETFLDCNFFLIVLPLSARCTGLSEALRAYRDDEEFAVPQEAHVAVAQA